MELAKYLLQKVSVNGSETFLLEGGSAYLYGTLEERSKTSAGGVSGEDCEFIHLEGIGDSKMQLEAGRRVVDCRKKSEVLNFIEEIRERKIYLDITGLSHDLWAPILNVAIYCNLDIYVMYMEPEKYAVSKNPTGGELFDLSERIDGIAPLPGFTNLSEHDDAEVPLVALLGFEGARFGYVLEHVQPAHSNIYPVIGVPGFRVNYPFSTFHGNITLLQTTRAWHNIRYITASCPYGIYALLEELCKQHEFIRVAPIGTKPHALGAIIFACKHPALIEIVYDYPKRKQSRTSGSGIRHIYHVSAFLTAKLAASKNSIILSHAYPLNIKFPNNLDAASL
jgi:hypothetical protein